MMGGPRRVLGSCGQRRFVVSLAAEQLVLCCEDGVIENSQASVLTLKSFPM